MIENLRGGVNGYLSAIVSFLFQLLAAVVTVILTPVDALINTLVPEATTAIRSFFTWVNSMIAQFLDFVNWFFYVLGIKPDTWMLIMTVCSALLLIWVFLFPLKLILSVFRGISFSSQTDTFCL